MLGALLRLERTEINCKISFERKILGAISVVSSEKTT